jgi:exodeoxyribonuclease VII small subunit
MPTPSFEDHLARLEQIAAELERSDVPLEQALALFEEGIARLRAATETLSAAEGKVRMLVERADGSLDLSDE